MLFEPSNKLTLFLNRHVAHAVTPFSILQIFFYPSIPMFLGMKLPAALLPHNYTPSTVIIPGLNFFMNYASITACHAHFLHSFSRYHRLLQRLNNVYSYRTNGSLLHNQSFQVMFHHLHLELYKIGKFMSITDNQ